MTAMTFDLKNMPAQRLDLSPLVPDLLAGKTAAAVGEIPLWCGNRQIATGQIFDVTGDDPTELVFRGTNGRCDAIGKGMTSGGIRIEGDAGDYTGFQMNGGSLEVAGNVGHHAACELKKGTLLIHGNTGDFLGSALPGNHNGMRGGVVIVKGNAGERVGDHLRRGAILIEGNAGAYLGARMTAGTIGVLGSVGPHAGYGMRRGTLLLARAPATIAPTFLDCGAHTLGFLPLLLKSFQVFDTRFAEMADAFTRAHRYAGDVSALGKGEILVRV